MSENNVKNEAGVAELPNINFLYKTMLARDPSKRRVKPTPTADLLPLALESESEDSDFRIEDNDSEEDSDSESDDTESDSESGEPVSDSEPPKLLNGSETPSEDTIKLNEVLQCKPVVFQLPQGIPESRVCCICLGTHSSDVNEVVECDSCGILVHEGCYGVTESGSISSTASSCSTEPWFCEPCQANIIHPPCQLCPNLGGALKETDTGLWVHLVCALYIPGIAFGEVDKLTQVTLFEMPYTRWGAKSCSLCSDPWLSRTGVCIGCDAGMCRTFFHVTCAQREGLLSETFHEDVVQADPFYANCKLHTEKSTMKRRKSNYLSHQRHLQWWTEKRNAGEELLPTESSEALSIKRILRKLDRQRHKFQTQHWARATWVPTQKMPRLLTTSASAVRRLRHKAVLMDVDVEGEELRESQTSALLDLPRKWHLPPAFSVEFIAYVIDRERRMAQLREQISSMKDECRELEEREKHLRQSYDNLIDELNQLKTKDISLQKHLSSLQEVVSMINPKKTLQLTPNKSKSLDNKSLRKNEENPPAKIKSNRLRESVESASLADNSNQSSHEFWVANIEAGPSNRSQGTASESQSLPAPVVVSPRMVLKRVIKSTSPRRPKKRKKSKYDKGENSADDILSHSFTFPTEHNSNNFPIPLDSCLLRPATTNNTLKKVNQVIDRVASAADYSTSSVSNELPKLKIKIKPVLPKVTQSGFPFIFANSDSDHSQQAKTPPCTSLEVDSSIFKAKQTNSKLSSVTCSICTQNGQRSDTVSCDECHRVFHFGCLDPPVKKTPKQRGYSWHCAECDPSDHNE